MIANTLRTNLAIQAITFATSIMIARILGPTGRGELALVLLYPQLMANVAMLGVDRAVAVLTGRRELARARPTLVRLVILLSIPAMLAGLLIIRWRVGDDHLAALATVYLAYMPAMQFFLLAVAMFNGAGDFRRFNRARLGFYVINLLLVAMVWLGLPLPLPKFDALLLLNLASVFGAFALCVWLLRGFAAPVETGADAPAKGGVAAVLALAIVFAPPVCLAQFNASAYQIVTEHHLGVKALGVLVIMITYSRLLSPIGGAIGSHVFYIGISGGRSDIARIFRLSLVVYLGCSVPLLLLAPWLIPTIFGREFAVDRQLVGILLGSAMLGTLADSLTEFLNGQGKVGVDVAARLAYLATLSLIGVTQAERHGLLGIAAAMATGDLLRCILLVKFVANGTESRFSRFWRIGAGDIAEILRGSRRLLGVVAPRR